MQSNVSKQSIEFHKMSVLSIRHLPWVDIQSLRNFPDKSGRFAHTLETSSSAKISRLFDWKQLSQFPTLAERYRPTSLRQS
jgi:hypothetical protein